MSLTSVLSGETNTHERLVLHVAEIQGDLPVSSTESVSNISLGHEPGLFPKAQGLVTRAKQFMHPEGQMPSFKMMLG